MANNEAKVFKRADLEQMICEVMGLKSITPMIEKHIRELTLNYDMTFKEIARCLVWYVVVQGKELSPIYGIRILANFKEPAAAYFKQLELDRQQQTIEAKKIVEYQDNNIIFNIKSIKHNKRKPKQLDINDINTKGDDDID